MIPIKDYVNAGFSGIWVQTCEPDEAELDLRQQASTNGWTIAAWDLATGMRGDKSECQGDPLGPVHGLAKLGSGLHNENTLLLLYNYHRFLDNPMVVQNLFNRVVQSKTEYRHVVILSPIIHLPPELEKVFVVIEHQLPDRKQLEEIAKLTDADSEVTPAILDAASGLTRAEAEGAFALAAVRAGSIRSEEIWEIKAGTLKKANLLTLSQDKMTFADLGGLDALKDFCKRALSSPSTKARAKGVLLLGLPGTGKTAFAKALGNETKRPTLLLDLGRLKGGLVGQSEQQIRSALKIADAMQPCILFVDEIEKALAGATGYSGDSGVSQDQFGYLLQWMNDHVSDVFFIGTCNDVKKLQDASAGAFVRAERWDGIFFFDMPTRQERQQIWELYRDTFGVAVHQRSFVDDDWTGAEIKSCCRLAALLGVDIDEAAKHIIPVATTSAQQIHSLREWAGSRCLSASVPGRYGKAEPVEVRRGRSISRAT